MDSAMFGATKQSIMSWQQQQKNAGCIGTSSLPSRLLCKRTVAVVRVAAAWQALAFPTLDPRNDHTVTRPLACQMEFKTLRSGPTPLHTCIVVSMSKRGRHPNPGRAAIGTSLDATASARASRPPSGSTRRAPGSRSLLSCMMPWMLAVSVG